MTPQEFKDNWTKTGGTLTPLTASRLLGLNLKSDTIDFLTQVGLPTDAAPFLSFADNSDDKYKGIARLTDQFDFLEDEFKKWIVIGSCGNGDPVAIDLGTNDEIYWLDHEDYFKPGFFNSSITALAASLVIYKDFILEVQKANGQDAFLNGDFSDTQFDTLKNNLLMADNKALSDNCFWTEQLECELGIRADNRKSD